MSTVTNEPSALDRISASLDVGAKPSLQGWSNINWGPAFRSANFTQIPNDVFNLVLQRRLIPFDLLTYAYFLGRTGAIEALGRKDYTFVSEAQTATDLNCSIRTVRASIARLAAKNLVERQDTPGFTHTRILVKVVAEKVVQRPRKFRPMTIRRRATRAVPPALAHEEQATASFCDHDETPCWL